MEEDSLADNLESKKGHWEYLHHPGSKIVNFQYWKEDSDTPHMEVDITPEEFNDLLDFAKSLKRI